LYYTRGDTAQHAHQDKQAATTKANSARFSGG